MLMPCNMGAAPHADGTIIGISNVSFKPNSADSMTSQAPPVHDDGDAVGSGSARGSLRHCRSRRKQA